MIPDPRNENPTPETITLTILSKKPRLTSKELYSFFTQKYKPRMTIQGFYRIIRQLLAKRILIKDASTLSIDTTWIHYLNNFTQTLNQTYLENNSTTANIILDEGEQKTFEFNNITQMDNFWCHTMVTVAHYYQSQTHPNKNAYSYNYYSIFQLARTTSEQGLTQTYQELGMHWYMVGGAPNFLNQLVAQTMDTPNFHYIQYSTASFKGEKLKPNQYITIIGDFIFEAFLPDYICNIIKDIHTRTTSIPQFNPQELTSLLTQPGKTIFQISRNKKRAENLRSQIIKIFKKTT